MSKKLFCLILGAILICAIAVIVLLSVQPPSGIEQQDGLQASLTTDKDSYDENEIIIINMALTNTNDFAVSGVQAELEQDSGLTLKSGEQTHTFGLNAGETLTIPYEVTARVGDLHGGDFWLWFTASLGAALLILLLVLLLRRKRSQPPADTGASGKKTAKRLLSLIIVLLLMLPYIASGTTAFAQEDSMESVTQEDSCAALNTETSAAAKSDTRSFSVVKSVSVNGAKCEIRFTFTYTVMAGAKTVTFETNGGSEIQPLMMQTGGTLFDMPTPVKGGSVFIGWYTDAALTKVFYSDTPIDRDMTLYADYTERDNNVEMGVEPIAYMEDCSEDIAFKIVSPISLTADNLSQYVELKAYLGDVPMLMVAAGDGVYTITPETPYTAGGHYQFTLLDDRLSFSGEDVLVREYAFRIYKEKTETVELNDNIKYVLWEDVTTLNDSVYSVRSSDYKIETGDVVCFWNGTFDNDTQMSNVQLATRVTGDETTPSTTVLYTEESDIDDVFEDINVYIEQDVPMSGYLSHVDTEKIAMDAKASEGTRQLTQFLMRALNASPSVASFVNESSSDGNHAITTLDDAMPPDLFQEDDDDDDDNWSEFIKPTENGDAVGITFDDLIEGLSITAKIGTAQNENFYNAGPDDWAVLTLTFEYNTVIKDKVEVKAQFQVKEYIKATMQGWKTKEGTYLEFDYALNMYSQTNMSLSVLIRSKDTSEDDYFDVTEELEKLTEEGDEEGDGSEVATILTEVLGNKGDDIELVDVSLFSYPLVLVQELPIFQINYDLNFVVSVNFAAGISAETNLMGAKQVGIYGNTRDGIDTYENTLPGANRYDFDLYCAGYFGIKTGLKMSISLSIYGLRSLGEIGMSGEVGVYLDIYGFLQLHIDKYYQHSDNYNLRLQGGIYMEFGLYVKFTIFAKSDEFKAKAEYVPYDQKFKLLSVGERYVLLNFANNGHRVLINTEKYSIKSNPALLDAEYIDLTTGQKVTGNYYDPSKFTMTFTSRYFAYRDQAVNVLKDQFGDYNTLGVTENTKRLDTEVTIYYLGNNMTFSSDEYGYTSKTVDLTWVDSSIDPNQYDDIDTVTATYVVDFGGIQTTLGNREVLFGQVPGSIDMMEYIINGTVTGYDNDFNQPIFEDTTYTVHISPYQRMVSFLTFYDGLWHLDVYPVNAGDIPALPEGYDASAGIPFMGWTRSTVGGNLKQMNKVEPLDTDITKYGVNYICEGLDTSKPLFSVAGSYDKCLEAYYEEGASKNIAYCTSSLYLYTAKYDMPDCNVSFRFPSFRIRIPDGTFTLSEKTYEFTFKYGQQLQCPYQPNFQYTDLLGWDADGDGIVDYDIDELPMATGDMTMTAVEEIKTFKVTVLDKDGKEDRTVDIKLGDLPSQLETTPEYPGDTDKYEFEGWKVSENGIDFELWHAAEHPGVFTDWTIKPSYTRLYAITFDFAGGVYNGEASQTVVVEAGEYTVSSIMDAVPLKPSDTYNTYVFSGWSCGASLTASDDTTVTAQYTETAIVYTAEFYTEQGTFVNGKTDDTFEGGYDAWQAFIGEYLTQNTKDTVEPVLIDDTVWSFERWNTTYTNSYSVRYEAVWKSAPREYSVTFNSGEGVFSGGGTTRNIGKKWHATDDFTAYNDVIKPADVYTTFKLAGWIDQNDTIYAPTDTYTVTNDMMLTAVYVTDERVEYTVNVSTGSGEFPDGDKVKTYKGYYGDPTNIAVDDPVYEITSPNIYYVFSGWSNSLPTTFTSNVTITAQYDTMYYEYTITFDAGLGTFAGSAQTVEKIYHYDEMVSLSETPTRAEDDYFTYTFDGWNPTLRKVDGDRTYAATYEAISKEATLPNAGITITDGTTSADISANHLPGEYQYQMEIAGSGSIPVLRITGDGLTISGSSSSVYIIIEDGVSAVTFNGLQLSGAYEYGHLLEFTSSDATVAVTISGRCLFENTFDAKQTIRSNRHMTLTGSDALAEFAVKSVDNSALYCERGMEVNDIDLNVVVYEGLGNMPYTAAFSGEGVNNPVWVFNDATVTVDSAGYGFETGYSVEINGGAWNMQCGKAAIYSAGFEVNNATLTASGAGGINVIIGNVTLKGNSPVHLTSTDNTVPVVVVEEAYTAGTGYLRLTDYTSTFIADYTVPPSTGSAVRTETGIELLVSGIHSPELFDLHGTVIALLNDGEDYYTFAIESVPTMQVQIDRTP